MRMTATSSGGGGGGGSNSSGLLKISLQFNPMATTNINEKACKIQVNCASYWAQTNLLIYRKLSQCVPACLSVCVVISLKCITIISLFVWE